MYARVARWEGQDPQVLREVAEDIRRQADAGERPEGVPLVGGMMLADYEHGTSLAIMLFETEEDRRRGDEAMRAMNPIRDTGGRRVSVEMFDVELDVRMGDRSAA